MRRIRRRNIAGRPQDPHNIPSQVSSKQVPYSPEHQPDVAQFPELQKPQPFGWGPYDSYVISTYDSRPINAIDFFTGEEIFVAITGVNQEISNYEFTVPVGRTAVLRHWEFSAIIDPGDLTELVTGTNGSGQATVILDFLLNGSAIPQYSGITLRTLPFGPVSGEIFLIVPQEQTIGLRATLQSSILEFEQTTLFLHGNLLLTDERSPTYQIGTEDPVPVTSEKREGFIAETNK